jgi:hypothetical protein
MPLDRSATIYRIKTPEKRSRLKKDCSYAIPTITIITIVIIIIFVVIVRFDL